MVTFLRKKLAVSAAVLFLAASSAQAQPISGYTGSTNVSDGYSSNVKKVTIVYALFDETSAKILQSTKKELIYDSKGRRISERSNAANLKYTYGNDYVIITSGNTVTGKAYFDANGALTEYTAYDRTGYTQYRDTYFYDTNGKIIEMVRTDGDNVPQAKWVYSSDSDGNTTITKDDGNAFYVYDSAGNLIKQIIGENGQTISEITYDEYGNWTSYISYKHPQAEMTQSDIPSRVINYKIERTTDSKGKVKEIITDETEKIKDTWLDPDGKIIASEMRLSNMEIFSWHSYRYDGKLAEVQTETWGYRTDENPTGYSSLVNEYFYGSNDDLMKVITYDETGNETEVESYNYADDGRLLTTITDDGRKTFYIWNDDGLLASKLSKSEVEGYFFQTVATEYSYNENGTMSKEVETGISMMILDEESEDMMQNTYRDSTSYYYNDAGLLTKKQMTNDERTDTNLYFYDDDGKKTKETCFTEYNDNRSSYSETLYTYEDDMDSTKVTEYKSSRTKKIYEYDASGNPKTIREYEIRETNGKRDAVLRSITEYTYN